MRRETRVTEALMHKWWSGIDLLINFCLLLGLNRQIFNALSPLDPDSGIRMLYSVVGEVNPEVYALDFARGRFSPSSILFKHVKLPSVSNSSPFA